MTATRVDIATSRPAVPCPGAGCLFRAGHAGTCLPAPPDPTEEASPGWRGPQGQDTETDQLLLVAGVDGEDTTAFGLVPQRRPVLVAGSCPMGCPGGLAVTPGGQLACTSPDCPRPTAVAEILTDRESEHLVDFTADTWTVRHPLRDRLDGHLARCPLPTYLAGRPIGLPQGTYRAREMPSGIWTWEYLGAVPS